MSSTQFQDSFGPNPIFLSLFGLYKVMNICVYYCIFFVFYSLFLPVSQFHINCQLWPPWTISVTHYLCITCSIKQKPWILFSFKKTKSVNIIKTPYIQPNRIVLRNHDDAWFPKLLPWKLKIKLPHQQQFRRFHAHIWIFDWWRVIALRTFF